jgi:hypothetical protein
MIPPRPSRFTGKTLSTRKERYEQAIPADEAEEMPRHVEPSDTHPKGKAVTLPRLPKTYGSDEPMSYRPDSGYYLGKS